QRPRLHRRRSSPHPPKGQQCQAGKTTQGDSPLALFWLALGAAPRYDYIMRRTRKFLLNIRQDREVPDGVRFVHVVSRTAGQEILFGDHEKETFRKILFKQLKFSGLRAMAWCFMGNHFHLLLEVPDKEVALATLSDDDVLSRLMVFGGEKSTKFALAELETCRSIGNVAGVERIASKVRARLFDLSLFMKELKLRMTLAYNFSTGRRGTLWEGRFKSVLVQGGEALRAVAAYIDLNPVRAGLVKNPETYRWCSYAAALGGMRQARAGLVSAISFEKKISWKVAAERYRKFMYGIGQEVKGTRTAHVKSKGGFTQREIEAVWEAGGKLTLAQALHCRIRYFTDGAVLGSQEFVDDFFARQRESFGGKRLNGGRRLKLAQWGDLRVLRDLKTDPVVTSSG
ncbi:MAG: putative transposase, partial [Verrucomicrobiales bacterium]